MKLHAGNIVINKPLERVYSFLTQLDNLKKQIPKNTIDDYEVELDDELSGEMETGTIVAIYLFAVYEGDEDRCIEFEVVSIEKNKIIRLELVYVGKYVEDEGDWSEPVQMESIFGVIGLEMKFVPKSEQTQIIIANTFVPKSKAFEIGLRIANFMGRLSSTKYYKEWAKLVEQHA